MRPTTRYLAMVVLAGLMLISALALVACGQADSGGVDSTGPTTTGVSGSSTSVTGSTSSSDTQAKTFTLDELAKFDGQNGNPAYVAVDGVVYDVSGSGFWANGDHTQCNLGATAGRDLSDVIAQAPSRMRAALQRMPVVGSLAP